MKYLNRKKVTSFIIAFVMVIQFILGATVTSDIFATIESPVINEQEGTVTFNLEGYGTANQVHIMGTITDWENGRAMTRSNDGIWSITLTPEPGYYEYKFRINGADWINDPLNPNVSGDGNSEVTIPGMVIEGNHPAGVSNHRFKAMLTDITNAKTDETENVTWGIKNNVPGATIINGVLTTTEETPDGYIDISVVYTGSLGTEVEQVRSVYYTNRAMIFQNIDPDMDPNADVYVWGNSFGEQAGYSFSNINGIPTTYVTLSDSETIDVGFILRLYGAWGAGDREFGDRTARANAGEKYTKVRVTRGVQAIEVLPSAKTYYDNGIVFNFRDDNLFYQNEMDSIIGVAIVINGETYDMVYSDTDELYSFPFQNIESGEYEYYFLVTYADGETIRLNDQYNPNIKNGNSYLTYVANTTELTSSVYPKEIHHDQNAVITVTSEEGVEIVSAHADMSALGVSNQVPLAVVDGNVRGTLYVNEETTAGIKSTPIYVRDAFGNMHTTVAEVTIVTKTAEDNDWDEARIYFLLTDRFKDGDPSNNEGNSPGSYRPDMAESYRGGDFKGVTEKLDYLSGLGINTIWITPIVENIDYTVNEELNQYGYHGYWAADFTKIDPHLGTTEDFNELIDEAHERGIKIMLDIVINHAGYGTYDNPNFEGMLRENPGTDLLTQELEGLPDFVTEDPMVRAKLIEWQTAWAAHTTPNGNRIDYFRVDTVKHVESQTWQELKTALTEVNPDFKMIGEFFGGSVHDNGMYLSNGQMDSLLDFEFKNIAKNFVDGDISSAEATLRNRNELLTSSITMGQFLSSHDEDGFLYTIDNDRNKMKVAATLLITAKGQPVIYYGEEIGLTGPNAFGIFENNRYDMKFDNLTEEEQDMLNHYTKVMNIRADYSKVLSRGDRTAITISDEHGYSVFSRNYHNESIIIGLNTNIKETSVTIDTGYKAGTILQDVYNNVSYIVDNAGQIALLIPASKNGGTAILVEEVNDESPPVIKGIVEVSYLDELGAEIASSERFVGEVETVYQTEEKDITGYTLKEVVGQVEGVFIDGTIEVKYIYTKDNSSSNTTAPNNNTPATGDSRHRFIVLVLGVFILSGTMTFLAYKHYEKYNIKE